MTREPRHNYPARAAVEVPTCFAMIPCEVLFDDRLSAGAVRYYAVLAAHATWKGPDAGCLPRTPQRQLAADARCSQAQARRHQEALIAAGHILKETLNGHTSRYYLPWLAVHRPKVDDTPTALTHERGTALTHERGQGKTALMGERANSECFPEVEKQSAANGSRGHLVGLWTSPIGPMTETDARNGTKG